MSVIIVVVRLLEARAVCVTGVAQFGISRQVFLILQIYLLKTWLEETLSLNSNSNHSLLVSQVKVGVQSSSQLTTVSRTF